MWSAGVLVAAIAALIAGSASLRPSIFAQGSCAPPVSNPIVCENAKTGNPAVEWDITGAGDSTIQGFATDISVKPGDTVRFKIATDATNYSLNIYRMGYYGGMGARKVAAVLPSATLPQTQPACLSDPATGLVDCGNWAQSAQWLVPATAVSGIYFAKLSRPDTGGTSHIVFVVRDDAGGSDLLFQTSDTTWEAYNEYGGNSLYTGSPAGRAYKVSYNRPFMTRGQQDRDLTWVFGSEYPMVRWLESNGYHVSYATGVDTDRRGAAALTSHKVFLSVGHDEYWSGTQRANVEAARAAGVHLGFFSANEVFWKTRWENSIDGTGTPYRTLVCYKETHANAKIDPTPAWTGTWRDPRFSPPSDGGRPENALTGTLFAVNGTRNDTAIVSQVEGQRRFWRNTSVAALQVGQTASFPELLGYEWDQAPNDGFQPAGLMQLSTTAIQLDTQFLLNYGSTFGAGTATHHLSLYRHASGALVFGAGTVQWPWLLDSNHDDTPSVADIRIQQATLNLFADMGVQPLTRQANLVPAVASTDVIPPTSHIVSPASGANVSVGVTLSVSGTATDAGGGVVTGVEVSVDNGATWMPATGTTSWQYDFVPSATGPLTIRSRAADDSGNLETPSFGTTITVVPHVCPCSIWGAYVPPSYNSSDTGAVELGVRFRAASAGSISALRFFKPSNGTGVHVGSLWSNTGTLLGRATFSNETASGWQQVALTPPVAVQADTTYVASYFAPAGHYAGTPSYFTSAVDASPLTGLADGQDGPNGVYLYTLSGGFPTNTFQSQNYWVDVVFAADTTPPTISGVTAGPQDTLAAVSWTTNKAATSRVDYGTSSSALNQTVSDSTLVTSHQVTLSPLTPSTTYYYRVTSVDVSGNSATFPAPPTAPLSFQTTAPMPPAAPSTLAATSVSPTQINLTWSNNATNQTGVKIERKTGAGGTYAQIAIAGATSTTYGDTALSASTTYFYRVRATNAAGNSAYSNEAGATTPAPPQPPAPPSGLTATAASSSQVNLAWVRNSTNETAFKIERKTGSGGAYAQIATAPAGATTYSDNSVTTSTTYFYRLRATNAGGDSAYSNEASVTVPATQTAGLTTVGGTFDSYDSNYLTGSKVTMSTSGQVVSMSVSVGPIDSAPNQQYQLAIYTDSGGRPGTLVAASATGTLVANSWNTIAVSGSLGAGASYWLMFNTNGRTGAVNNMPYDVGAVGIGAYSSASVALGTWPATFPASTLSSTQYSLYATFLPGPPPPPPAAPSGLAGTAASSNQVSLSWIRNSTNEAGFKIERKLGAGGTYAQIATAPAGATTYSDASVSASTTYFYRVRATNAGGDSAYSNEAGVTVPATQTLGLTTIGGAFDSDDNNYLTGSKVTTSTTSAHVTTMSVYVGNIDTGSNAQYQLAIYTDSAGKPGTLVAASATGTLVGNSWNTITVNAPLAASTSYWLMFNTNGRSGALNNMAFNTGSAGMGAYSSAPVSFGTWPTAFPAATIFNLVYSLNAVIQ